MNGVIRGRCPRCGGKIIYSEFYQNARDYTIRKDGKVPKRYVSRSGELSESVAACENGCGAYKSFVTKQTTYCNALRQWAKRETDPNVIGSIYYGCALPEDLEKEVGDILSAAQAQITAIINKLSA